MPDLSWAIQTVAEDYHDRDVHRELAALAGVDLEEWHRRTFRRTLSMGGRLQTEWVAPMREQLRGQTVVFVGSRVGQLFGHTQFLQYETEGEDWTMVPARYEAAVARDIVGIFLRDLVEEQGDACT